MEKINKNTSKQIASSTEVFKLLESTLNQAEKVKDVTVKSKINAADLENISKLAKSAFGIIDAVVKSGVFTSLGKVQKGSRLVNKIKLKMIFRTVIDVMDVISGFGKELNKKMPSDKILKDIQSIDKTIQEIMKVFTTVEKIKVGKIIAVRFTLPLIFMFLRSLMRKMIRLGIRMTILSPFFPIIAFGLTMLNAQVSLLSTVLKNITDIKIGKSLVNLLILPVILGLIKLMIIKLSLIRTRPATMTRVYKTLTQFLLCCTELHLVIDALVGIKGIWKVRFKIRAILKTLPLISRMLNRISRMRVNKRAITKLATLLLIITELNLVYKALLLTSIGMILFLLVAPAVMLSLLAVALIVKIINLIRVRRRTLKSIAALMLVSLALVLLSGALLLAGLAMSLLEPKMFLLMILYITTLVLLVALMGFVQKEIVKGAIALVVLSLALIELSVGLILMGIAGMLWDKVSFAGLLVMITFLMLFIGVVAVAGIFIEFVLPGAIAIAVLAVSMLLVAGSLLVMAVALKMFNEIETESIEKMCLAILGFAGTVALVGLMTPLILLGSVAMIPLATSMLLMTAAISAASKIDAEEGTEKLKQVVTGFVDAATSIFDGKGLAGSVELMAKLAAAKKAFRDLMIIAGSISKMAKVVSGVANLQMEEFDEKGHPTGKKVQMKQDDFVKAAANMAAIVFLLSSIFGEEEVSFLLGDGSEVTVHPVSMTALDNLTGSTKRKIKRLSKITEYIGKMALTVQSVASLAIPEDFDKDGKPTGYKQMTEDDFVKASANIATIATTILTALSDPELNERIEDMSMRSIKKMKRILEIGGNLGNLIQAIKDVVNMTVGTEFDKDGKAIAWKTLTPEEIDSATQKVADIMTTLLTALSSDEITEVLDNMDRKAVKNMEKVMNATGNISPLIDSIKKLTEMDDEQIHQGIGRLQLLISNYASMLETLFVEKSHLEMKWKEKDLGLFTIKYPSIEKVVDAEPLINMDSVKKANKKLNELMSSSNLYTKFIENINKIGNDPKFNIENHTKTIENFSKLIDKTKEIDVSKIKSVTEMMSEMARFSESIDGNFERLADVLNEKLLETLEKIQETLKGISENSSSSSSSSGNEKESLPAGPNTPSDPNEKPNTPGNNQNNIDLSKIETALGNIKSAIKSIQENGIGKSPLPGPSL